MAMILSLGVINGFNGKEDGKKRWADCTFPAGTPAWKTGCIQDGKGKERELQAPVVDIDARHPLDFRPLLPYHLEELSCRLTTIRKHPMHRLFPLCLALVFAASPFNYAVAQNPGSVSGTVKDSQNGEPLPGANISLTGTGLGAISDMSGRFSIKNVPPGSYTLRVTYVGYRPASLTVAVAGSTEVRKDFRLTAVAIEGETIVVTAQAAGQKEAINQQLTSLPVMNVVSAARIQELPDANAAESVGRLPGVSLIRTGGEGSKVVIRGLSPQYNQITIDGVELSSNSNSVNNIVSGDRNQDEGLSNALGDRGMDLSMISSSMLGGIEVIKAITPDMDATVLGGVVNFDMRKAARDAASRESSGWWIPHVEFASQSGYNKLKATRTDYKFVGSLEKRFFDDALGVFVQATAERRNLSANELGVSYNLSDKDHGDLGTPDLERMSMADVFRTRERSGGSVVLDYQHSTGEIGLMNTVSFSTTRVLRNEEALRWRISDIFYTIEETNNKLSVLSNILSLKQDIGSVHLEVKGSHTYSESFNPEDASYGFWQRDGSGFENLADGSKLHPQTLSRIATPDPWESVLASSSISNVLSKERTLNASLNAETGIPLLDMLAAKIKVGGAVQHRTRDYDINTMRGGNYWLGGGAISAITRVDPTYALGGLVGMPNFVNWNYRDGGFLDGEYPLTYELLAAPMWRFLQYFKKDMSPENGYRDNVLETQFNDYSGSETKSAGYAMATFSLGDEITLLPGVRYQNLSTTYTAMRGRSVPGGLQGNDTTVTQSHGYYLPMVHLRYRPTDWLQLHFAYTNTLNYPDYSTITPRYYIGESVVYYNNYRIRPARSENLDLVLSLHSNELGLLSLDGFKKRIKDLIFYSRSYVTNLRDYPDLPQGGSQLFEFNTYINNPMPIDVIGLETEWQTNFWYLPEPLSGLVLTVNYTHIFSESSYPRSIMNVTYQEDGTASFAVVDTFYTTRLLNQPNDILNLAVGYDYGGFSARVSLLYQDNIFKKADFWMQNRINSAKFSRWDIAIKQQLPWLGLQLYLDLNNITGEKDVDVNQRTGLPANEVYYGMTADMGLRIRL
jgi:hypothetical protein